MNLNNPKIWAVTDGSQGMISQANGLAKQLSSDIKIIKTDLLFPWNKLQPGILPIFNWVFKNKIGTNEKPDIIISCGRKSVYFSLFFKKKFEKIINIHIQNPKVSSKFFSYIISPNHDKLYGSNIINSVGALHHFDNLGKNSDLKVLSCIVGGYNHHYNFDTKEAIKLSEKLIEIKNHNPEIDLHVITSRRTSNLVNNILTKKLYNISKIWTGEGKNPYLDAIQTSSFFIVTSDSTSMISEVAITGKPIYVYHLPLKRKSKRILDFHEEFNKLGITRDVKKIRQLKKWVYDPLNESKRIASIIKKRIIEECI